MQKAGFKKFSSPKEHYNQWTLRDKRYICISRKQLQWMKRYINRAPRRKRRKELQSLGIDEQ